jgi:hypothetical protein
MTEQSDLKMRNVELLDKLAAVREALDVLRLQFEVFTVDSMTGEPASYRALISAEEWESLKRMGRND